jgi:hypothetical protein
VAIEAGVMGVDEFAWDPTITFSADIQFAIHDTFFPFVVVT